MNKGSNSKSNTSSKKKAKNNEIFEIIKTKMPKNRKNSIEPENVFLSYNLHEKKNTSLKKIFLYHEISDKLKLNNSNNSNNRNNNETNLNSKNKNLLEKNYMIKCIFLDRHIKSYTQSEKNCELTLDLIEKEEKSKIIDLYLIKSDLISEDFKSINNNNNNGFNFLNRKTLSNSNLSFNSMQNPNASFNCKKEIGGLSSNFNANCGGFSNFCNSNTKNNEALNNSNNNNSKSNNNNNSFAVSGNLNSASAINNGINTFNNNTNNNYQNVNQELKNVNNLSYNDRKILKQKFLSEISNYINSITLNSPASNPSNSNSNNNNNISNKAATANSNTENSNLSNEIIRKDSSIKNNQTNFNTNQSEKPEFKNFFAHFIQYFPEDFDCFEHEVIKILSAKMVFSDFSNIFLFLYDDLKKLRDQKTIELLKNKLKENVNEDLSILRLELRNFYEYRSSIINNFLGKAHETSEWTDERILNEILLTSLISEKLKNTNEFDLTQNYIMGKNIQMIMSALKFNNFIWKIVLNSNKIGEEGMFLLGRVLHFNNKITDLDISLNFLTDKAIGLFVKGIDNTLVNLQRLNLSNNNALTSACGERLKEILVLAPNLKTLNISRINLEKGILKVFEGLLFNQNLEELICIYTSLNDEILVEIANFFSEYNELIKLKKLNLSDNKFNGPCGPKEFFGALARNSHLKELVMYNCKMDNSAFDCFCRMAKLNNCLEKVSFYNNDFCSMENLKRILRIKKMNLIARNAANAAADKIIGNSVGQAGNVNNFEFENIKSGNKFIFLIFFLE